MIGIDHFKVLGLEETATSDEIKMAYFGCVNTSCPTKLTFAVLLNCGEQPVILRKSVSTLFYELSTFRPFRKSNVLP